MDYFLRAVKEQIKSIQSLQMLTVKKTENSDDWSRPIHPPSPDTSPLPSSVSRPAADRRRQIGLRFMKPQLFCHITSNCTMFIPDPHGPEYLASMTTPRSHDVRHMSQKDQYVTPSVPHNCRRGYSSMMPLTPGGNTLFDAPLFGADVWHGRSQKAQTGVRVASFIKHRSFSPHRNREQVNPAENGQRT